MLLPDIWIFFLFGESLTEQSHDRTSFLDARMWSTKSFKAKDDCATSWRASCLNWIWIDHGFFHHVSIMLWVMSYDHAFSYGCSCGEQRIRSVNPSRQGAVHVASDKARAVIENSQLKAMNFSQAPPSLVGIFFQWKMWWNSCHTKGNRLRIILNQVQQMHSGWVDWLVRQGQIDAIYQLPDTERTQRTEHHRAGALISDWFLILVM